MQAPCRWTVPHDDQSPHENLDRGHQRLQKLMRLSEPALEAVRKFPC